MAVFAERIDETMVARMQSFFQTLSEKDQRRYSALESQQFGHGESRISSKNARKSWPTAQKNLRSSVEAGRLKYLE